MYSPLSTIYAQRYNLPYNCIQYCIGFRQLRQKSLAKLIDPGYWFLEAGCFWILFRVHYRQLSSIDLVKMTVLHLPLLDCNADLCNVKVRFKVGPR